MINFDAEENQILALIKKIEAAENRKDAAGVAALMTEDAVMQKAGVQLIRGRQAWIADYEQFFEHFISTTITPLGIEIAESGELAWGFGTFVSYFEGSNALIKVTGKFLGIYRKQDGIWRGAAVSIAGNA